MLTPIYSKWDGSRWIFGLNEDDFMKVQAGYACGNCLEDYHGKWLPKCPVCGATAQHVDELPREWMN